jgi:hypothetical protein
MVAASTLRKDGSRLVVKCCEAQHFAHKVICCHQLERFLFFLEAINLLLEMS